MNGSELNSEATWSLLGNRPFRRLSIAQFFATAVAYSLALAGATLVEEQTRSSAQTGLVIVSSILPAFLGSLVAGTVADRWGRTRAIRTSHLIRGLVALAFWLGTRYLPLGAALIVVYVANATCALFTQLGMTGELALLPDLVNRPRLAAANAFYQLNMLVAEGLGIIALAPLLVKTVGPSAVGLVGTVLFALAFALVAPLPKDKLAARENADREPIWENLQAGWRAIAADRVLIWVTIQATLAATLLLVLLSLLPGLLARHLGMNVEDMPFMLLPGGLGFALGSYLAGRWDRPERRLPAIALGLIALGGGIGLVSLASGQQERAWLLIPPILSIGLALAFVIIPARTVLQEQPPAPLRGRVIAAQLAMTNATAILPLLLGGTLADQVGIRPVMGILGIVAAGAGLLGLREARSRRAQEEINKRTE